MKIPLKPSAFAIICSLMSVAAANGQTRAARPPSRPAVPDAASVQGPPALPAPAAAPAPPAPAAPAPAAAQAAPAPPAPPAAPVPPLKVQIVISRYQGEKKVASMPYTLSIGGGNMNRASVRMGGRVPVATFGPLPAPSTADGKDKAPAPTGFPFQYQDLGTNLDCAAWPATGGRFRLDITIDDTSVYPEPGDAAPARGTPTFRTFRTSDSVVVRDGETTQVTSAVDKVTGEVVKIDVTLTVVK